jgi:hypothetical protein
MGNLNPGPDRSEFYVPLATIEKKSFTD